MMRKVSLLLILLIAAGATSFAQQKSGTVFSEHEAIDAVKESWQAFISGDVDKYLTFFSDTIMVTYNGSPASKRSHEQMKKAFAYWHDNYEDLKVWGQKGAIPDAIEYKDGGTWVMDWIVFSAIHKESGVVLKLPIHEILSFDEDGKIVLMASYFDDSVFDDIDNSTKTIENGKVYIHHPHISTVRKAMNAFVAKDLDSWSEYFHPEASFSSSIMKPGGKMNLEEMKKYFADTFYKDDIKFKVVQQGYPDCIYYAKNDMYVVYSWWNMVGKKGDDKFEFGFMLSFNFDQEGKIVNMITYISSNHLEGL